MSTILKALRRLEEQKTAATPRPLRDEVVLVPARRRRHSGVVVALLAAFAFAVLGGAAVWLLDRAPAKSAESIAASAPSLDVAAPPPIAVVQPEQATEVTVASPDPIATGAQAPPVPVPVAPLDFEIVHPRVAVQRAPLEQPATDDYDDYGDAVAVERPSAAPPLPDTRSGYVDESIPAARVARTRSPVRVERTQWHPDPDRRVAWVEVDGMTALREVREGERVGPYLVREIEPAAVLFADGSVEVRSEVGR